MIRNDKGYNLLMLSVIVLALAIIMSAVLSFYSITNYKRRIFTTTSRFEEIDLAIKSFVAKYNRFPCPAPLNCNTDGCVGSSDQLGIEKADTNGNCIINSDAGIFQAKNSSAEDIYYGGVPTLTLGLANNYINDAWGNKIVYIIPKELTEDSSYYKFLYAKNHTDKTSITINGVDYPLNREYVKDGIVYLLAAFNKNTIGAYLYENKKVNSFSGSENYPITDFTVNYENRKFLFYGKNYKNFKIEGLEEEMQICPDIPPDGEYINSSETGYTDMTFHSAKYGEVVFSNEFCGSQVNTPAQASDYYYMSTYRVSGLLVDNRAAKRCGKNGEWEDGFVYECELLPRCVKPANSEFYAHDWTSTDFTVSNMGEAQSEDSNPIRIKCVYTDTDGAKWYQIDHI